MPKILEIYEKYKIIPQLQLHQLRVAAVASQICSSFEQPPDVQAVITACLLHDMGNIIKFDLGLFPETLKPQGLEYWQEAQQELKNKYGEDEHDATMGIAKELGVSNTVLTYVNAVGFTKAVNIVIDPSLEKKICNYSDYRVTPFKIVTLEESIADRAERYKNHPKKGNKDLEFVEKSRSALRELEKQIFEKSSIKPEEITDSSVSDIVTELKNFSLS